MAAKEERLFLLIWRHSTSKPLFCERDGGGFAKQQLTEINTLDYSYFGLKHGGVSVECLRSLNRE